MNCPRYSLRLGVDHIEAGVRNAAGRQCCLANSSDRRDESRQSSQLTRAKTTRIRRVRSKPTTGPSGAPAAKPDDFDRRRGVTMLTVRPSAVTVLRSGRCLLYTSDAAD